MDIRKFAIPEMFFDRGSIDKAGESVLKLQAGRILIVSDEEVDSAGWLTRLTKKLQDEGLFWSCYRDDSTTSRDIQVEQAVEVYRENQLEGVVAIGGCSSLDIAKGVAAIVTNGGRLNDYSRTKSLAVPLPPMMFITAMDGSGADSDKSCLITGWIKLHYLPRVEGCRVMCH